MKTKLLILFAIIIFTSLTPNCLAKKNDYPNRKAFKLDLEINDTNYFQAEIPESPIVLASNSVQLYPGEEVFVEVELDSVNKIKSLNSVKKNLHPKKTLVISFEQIANKHIHEKMVLSIYNPFDMELIYKPSLLLFKISDWLLKKDVIAPKNQLSVEVFTELTISISLIEMEFRR